MRPLLGPFLGHVTATTARAWIRMPRNAPLHLLEVAAQPLAGAHVGPAGLRVDAMDAVPGGDGTAVATARLSGGPSTLHRIEVRFRREGLRPEEPLGTLLARAAELPSDRGRIAFAFGSCWKVNALGDVGKAWRLLEGLARARHVDHLLLLGDQIYADETPLKTSLVGRTATRRVNRLGDGAPRELRLGAYREAYQQAFEQEDLGRALARLPSVAIWDDHEIINGWGSAAWHDEAEGRRLFDAAASGYDEYQGARNPPPLEPSSRAHAFRRGPAAFLVLDLRTHRHANPAVILGEEQRAAVAAWLRADDAATAPVLFVACSVPPLHLRRLFNFLRGPLDVRDQWSHGANEAERAWLLRELLDHRQRTGARIVLLGGDAHLATAVRARDSTGVLWQLTSSPLANRLPTYVYPALTLLGRRFHVRVEGRPERLAAHVLERWRGSNVGVITGEATDAGVTLRFELFRPGRRTQLLTLD
jgi:hypothetical protein